MAPKASIKARDPALPAGPEENLGLERVVFFSDAVIAIAITLLAIDIQLPPVSSSDRLVPALLDLWPRYLSFAISFLVVGSYWMAHHRMFRMVRRYDGQLLWLNNLFLLCVAFVPFSTGVIGEYGDEPSAAIFYTIVIALTGLVEALLWIYASRGHRLVSADLSAHTIRLYTLRALTPPSVVLLSLPLVLIHPYVAIAAWLLMYPVLALIRRTKSK